MALPLLAGLAGVAGKAALKKIAKTMAKKKPEPTGKYTKDGIPKRYMPGKKARSQELIKKLEKVESKPDNLQKFSGESRTRRLSDEFNVDDYRKGGKVKKTGARRGDGCATKGKTRGRMV